MEPVCTGYGSRDTHAVHLSDGQRNPHPSAGTPYGTIAPGELYAMAADPPATDKLEAQWIIPSSYVGHDARSHAAQRERGRFHYLAADIDKGSPELDTVREAVERCLGDVYALFYATASCAPGNLKWRVLVPLAHPLEGESYTAYQASFFDALEACGIQCDRSLERPGQLVYLPNRGEHYQYATQGRALLHAQVHPMSARAESYLNLLGQAQTQAQASGSRSFIAAFLRRHPLQELLPAYGFVQCPTGRPNWRSPYQTGGSYATRVYEDQTWFSLSYSDRDAGMGRRTSNGVFGDAYDLYVHFTCKGNEAAAEQYARQCLKLEEDARYGAATTEHGRSLWLAYLAAIEAARMASIEQVKLAPKEGNNNEWQLDWPPGFTGELAKWIYASSSRPVKQYSVAAALYFMTVAGRKYNVEGKGLNLFMLLVGGTGRGKGVVKTAVDKFVRSVVMHSTDPSLAAPFRFELSVSEAGIRKALLKQNPICAYQEELGAVLLPLAKVDLSDNNRGLQSMITRTFDSGESSSYGTRQASSDDNTKGAIDMPCFTLAGDTQPHIYRSLLGSGMIDSGFAPRMVPFFYYGKRAYHNRLAEKYPLPPAAVVQHGAAIAQYALQTGEKVVHVAWDPEVREEYYKLDEHYTDRINGGEPGAELLNRASLLVARIAGLLAVGCNHLQPTIDRACYGYALAVVQAGLTESQRIIQHGGAGSGESVRMYQMTHAISEYVRMDMTTRMKSYRTPRSIAHRDDIVGERYFLERFKNSSDFRPTSGNATTQQIIREAIQECVRQGMLQLMLTPPPGVHANVGQKLYGIYPDQM